MCSSSMSRSPFKRVKVGPVQPPADIESLFKELKNRNPRIKDLFAHQADIIRAYFQKYLDSKHVALELPTGSGKTLVALLIAEYRRIVRNERVLYLCPTRQLVYQVAKHSKDYAIDTRVFVGKKRDYDRQALTLYRTAKTIAIATYSGLFNISPGLNDPQLVILDDAHGAETYIAQMWSVDIDRDSEGELYHKILAIYVGDMPSEFARDMVRDSRPQGPIRVEKVPSGSFLQHLSDLTAVIDEHLPGTDSDVYFSWTVVRNGLHACHVYISWDRILIRPYIPPTLTHTPFANANQRIYMSATLGSGGELERITGVPTIDRIPLPKTYTSYGVGRRLFLFPDFAKEPNEYESWLAERVAGTDRTLALCPTNPIADIVKNIVSLAPKPVRVLGPNDIEASMKPFTTSTQTILILSNRYDGIDLPEEDCHQLLMFGLPNKTNLQEAFLEERLGLEVLLRERIKTRISQGAGRCTRSDTDHAVVIMAGRTLLDYCAKSENQRLFHPELRAEMRFALGQSARELTELDVMSKEFLSRTRSWEEAEQNIRELKTEEEPPEASTSSTLSKGAKHEVDFAYSAWAKDYPKAVQHGRSVLDTISGTQALTPYTAFWYYLVASMAQEAAKSEQRFRPIAEQYLNKARDACKTVSWFSYALRSVSGKPQLSDPTELQAIVVEGIETALKQLGVVGLRFQKRIDETAKLLESSNSKQFDRGLVDLGTMLGFNSWKPEGSEGPDAVWQLGSSLAFLLEGKAGQTPSGGVSVDDCRQTSGHLDWAKGDDRLKSLACFTILVSPRSSIARKAITHSDSIYYWSPTDALTLFKNVSQLLTNIRTLMTSNPESDIRVLILEKMTGADLTPESVKDLLMNRLVAKLPVND